MNQIRMCCCCDNRTYVLAVAWIQLVVTICMVAFALDMIFKSEPTQGSIYFLPFTFGCLFLHVMLLDGVQKNSPKIIGAWLKLTLVLFACVIFLCIVAKLTLKIQENTIPFYLTGLAVMQVVFLYVIYDYYMKDPDLFADAYADYSRYSVVGTEGECRVVVSPSAPV